MARLLTATTIIGGAGALLLVGTASAAPLSPPLCWFGQAGGGATTECTTGLQFELQDKLVTLGNLDWGGKSGTLGFQYTPIDPPPGLAGDSFAMALDFNPDSNGPYDGQFDYVITITDPNYRFVTAQLDSIVTGVEPLPPDPVTTVTKRIFGFADLVSSNGSNVNPIPVSGSTLTVENIWDVKEGTILDGFKDVYTQAEVPVPGPLPVMGAGMAFGFSRRLRRRINAGECTKG